MAQAQDTRQSARTPTRNSVAASCACAGRPTEEVVTYSIHVSSTHDHAEKVHVSIRSVAAATEPSPCQFPGRTLIQSQPPWRTLDHLPACAARRGHELLQGAYHARMYARMWRLVLLPWRFRKPTQSSVHVKASRKSHSLPTYHLSVR